MLAQNRGSLVTRTLPSEFIYNYSGSKHVSGLIFRFYKLRNFIWYEIPVLMSCFTCIWLMSDHRITTKMWYHRKLKLYFGCPIQCNTWRGISWKVFISDMCWISHYFLWFFCEELYYIFHSWAIKSLIECTPKAMWYIMRFINIISMVRDEKLRDP